MYAQSPSLTSLHLAESQGHIELAQMVLEHNAKVDAQEENGVSPLAMVAHAGHHELAQMIHEYYAKEGRDLQTTGRPGKDHMIIVTVSS
ncbi:hypothetical protein BGW80DRAFT_230894 [Lactifluus volemus]|nr:hypothetical protein BGW80DRAFT_230894 [Lactifluus volemus]